MSNYKLYYATNRNHEGKDRWQPKSYGTKFSADGMENLRFGMVEVSANDSEVNKHLRTKVKDCGVGDGEKLSEYLAKCSKRGKIRAFQEKLDPKIADVAQDKAKLGSKAMFAELKRAMENSTDVLIYIHGFNVSWDEAVGAALALQIMLSNAPDRDGSQEVLVVLFSWPSDGLALPWVSYKSDRSEAKGSGAAVGRAMLKVRDFLADLRDRARGKQARLCGQDIHLLCHSMGNYVLQHALGRIAQFTPSNALPRMFEHVFLCAPDVDDDALEAGQPLGKLHEIARHVSIYHNKGDAAMYISDYTKGHPERLGGTGAAHPSLLHTKVQQIDCTPMVHGMVEHSYYLAGHINADIRASIDDKPFDDTQRMRKRTSNLDNVWVMPR
jgi:esterase/lipase superfamily enzyme